MFDALSDPGLLAGVTVRAEALRGALTEALGSTLREIRGVGLLMGVVLDVEAGARDIAKAAFDQGLLVVPASGNVVRFLPPLDAPEEDLREAARRLHLAVEQLR